MKHNKFLITFALLSAVNLSAGNFCTLAQAQQVPPTQPDKGDTLDVSTVTASLKPSRTLSGAPVQAIDNSTLELLGIQELHEAIKGFAGVNVRDYGGVGGVKTVSIRSLGASHTAVSYDGMAISNIQSGQVDIGRFSLDNVEQVSISIGQSDDIFQSARLMASAGVLDIRTGRAAFAEGGKKFNLQGKLRAASFCTWNPSLLWEQRLGKRWSLSLTGDWLGSKDNYPYVVRNGVATETRIRKNCDVNRTRAELNVYGDFGNGGQLTVKVNALTSQRGLPSQVILYNDTANERLWERNHFARAAYEVKLSQMWELKAGFAYTWGWNRYARYSKEYATGVQEDRYAQREFNGSVTALFKPWQMLHFSLSEDLSYNTMKSDIPKFPFPERVTSLTSLAAQYRSERLTVTGSLLATFTDEKVRIGKAADNRSCLTPAISASWKLSQEENFRIRASYKDIYRLPTFNDLYYERSGSRDLKPERARQFNLGLTWNGAAGKITYMSATLDGFYNKVSNKIVTLPTMFIWKTMNMGVVDIYGLDASFAGKWQIDEKMALDLSATYTLQFALDVTDPKAKNYRHQIPYTPRNAGNGALIWSNPWVNLGYTLNAVGARYALPQNISANLIDGYWEHNLSASHTFDFDQVKIHLQGELLNFTNTNYEVIKYYPMPGISWRLTLKINI